MEHRGSIVMRKASILAVAALSIQAMSASAEPKVANETYLASESEKTWTVTAFVQNLGDGTCKEGEEYTFKASGEVTRLRCDGAKPVEDKYDWSLKADGIDRFLSFNEMEYRLTAWTEKNADLGIYVHKLLLRVESVKNVETSDIEMQHVQ